MCNKEAYDSNSIVNSITHSGQTHTRVYPPAPREPCSRFIARARRALSRRPTAFTDNYTGTALSSLSLTPPSPFTERVRPVKQSHTDISSIASQLLNMAAKLFRFGGTADAAGEKDPTQLSLGREQQQRQQNQQEPEVSTAMLCPPSQARVAAAVVRSLSPPGPAAAVLASSQNSTLRMTVNSVRKHRQKQRNNRGEKGGLWRAATGENDQDCSSTLRKMFRFALGQVLGLPSSYHICDGAVGEVLEKEAKAQVPEAILTLLSRLVDAERAAAMPRSGDGGKGGEWEMAMGSNAVAAAPPPTAAAAAAAAASALTGGLVGAGRKRRLSTQQEEEREKGDERKGNNKKSKGRRVSFSTYDLSVVDTPDPQRNGSDRPMEGVLSSLFLALKAAETLRGQCAAARAAGGRGRLSSSLSPMVAAREGGGRAGGENQVPLLGKENVRQQVFAAWNSETIDQQQQQQQELQHMGGPMKPASSSSPSSLPFSLIPDPIASTRSSSTKEWLDKLVQVLHDFSTAASAAAVATRTAGAADMDSGKRTFAQSLSQSSSAQQQQQQQQHGIGSMVIALLGETAQWNELSVAASFYAKELHMLCLSPHESLFCSSSSSSRSNSGIAMGGEGSRLLNRYHETLSSMIRYELKRCINLCYCACDLPEEEEEEEGEDWREGGEEGMEAYLQEMQQQRVTAAAAAGEPSAEGQVVSAAATTLSTPRTTAAGGGGGATAVPPFILGVHGRFGMGLKGGEGGENLRNCCSAMQILVETASSLQYNNDDPAALLHFALRKVYCTRGLWTEFCGLVTERDNEGAAAPAAVVEGGLLPAVLVPEGEEDRNVGLVSPQAVASKIEAGKEDQEELQQRYTQKETQEEEVKEEQCPRRVIHKTNYGTRVPAPASESAPTPTPAWWSLAESKGSEILGFLGAAAFLVRVLKDPVVVQAVNAGKWGRVERFAGMVSGVLGVVSEEDSLRSLADVGALQEDLYEALQAVHVVRQIMAATTPAEVLASVPPSHFAALAPRRKRKRVARVIKGAMRDVLIWVRSSELPEQATYPHLAPLCVYATAGIGYEEETADDGEDEEGEEENEELDEQQEQQEEGQEMVL